MSSRFSNLLVEPLAMLVALVVLAAQLIVGGCLLTNRFVRPARPQGLRWRATSSALMVDPAAIAAAWISGSISDAVSK